MVLTDPRESDHVVELDLNFLELVPDLVEFYYRHHTLGQFGQLSLKRRPGQPSWSDGIGSLYSLDEMKFLTHEREFTEVIPEAPLYVGQLIASAEAWLVRNFRHRIGRVRFMALKPKTCLSYHRDAEAFRLHIPLVTSEKCFFIVNDQLSRMRISGRGYLLRTDVYHTAVNADLKLERLHLVFSTYGMDTL